MPSVTGYTNTKVDALIAGLVNGATINPVTGELTLTTKDGTVIDVGSVLTGIIDSSTTAKGIVELATDVETQTGTDSTRAVTPFGMASVVANASGRGLIELATNAEVIAGTDAVRAVTPAGLLSSIVVSGIAETAAPSAYPFGTSVMSLSSSTWSLNSGNGTVVTENASTDHCLQRFFYTSNGGFPRTWTRMYVSTSGGWQAWQELGVVSTLAAGSFVQATLATSYPSGTSRLYYTTVNSTSWDFAGKAGEVTTFRDVVNDFTKQTWTRHSGSTPGTETWIRTSNTSTGWSPWLIVAEDTGWVSLGTLTSGYTLKTACQCRRVGGIVHLRGAFLAPNGGFTSSGLVVPAGFRPSVDIGFAVTTNTTIQMTGMVTAAGQIQTWTTGVSSSSFHISGVTYPIN
jgi:hypothetical protein